MSNKKNQTDRADAMFKRMGGGKSVLTDHHAAAQTVRDKTARLRALRLAKEAADKLGPNPCRRRHAGPGNKQLKAGKTCLPRRLAYENRPDRAAV